MTERDQVKGELANEYDEHKDTCAKLLAARNEVARLEAELETLRAGSLTAYLQRQEDWSSQTFGQGLRTRGIIEHIKKELAEVLANPHDLSEWVDVVILALDGYWRHGGVPETIMDALNAKQEKNFSRFYPKPESEDVPSEHIRTEKSELETLLGNKNRPQDWRLKSMRQVKPKSIVRGIGP